MHTPSLPLLACRPWAVHVPTAEPCPWAWPNALRDADETQLAALQGHPLHDYYDSCGYVKT